MPFKSYAEMSWMKHNKPELYAEWMRKYGSYKGTKLHVSLTAKRNLKDGFKRVKSLAR